MDVKEKEFWHFYSIIQEQEMRVISSEFDDETNLSLLRAIGNFKEELDRILIQGVNDNAIKDL